METDDGLEISQTGSPVDRRGGEGTPGHLYRKVKRLIAGGTKGIGRAIADLSAGEGCDVSI